MAQDYNDRLEQLRDEIEPKLTEMIQLLNENDDVVRASRAEQSRGALKAIFLFVAGEGRDKVTEQVQ